MPSADSRFSVSATGKAGSAPWRSPDSGDGTVYQFGVDERANGIMDQNLARCMASKRKQPEPDGVLPGRATGHRDDSIGVGSGGAAKKRAVVGVDGDDDGTDSRMRQKHIQCARDNGMATDPLVLLRAVGLTGARAAAGGDDNHGNPRVRSQSWHFACICHAETLSA